MSEKSLIDTINHIRLVQKFMAEIISRLEKRLLLHDDSKLNEPELSGYDGLSDAPKGLEYGSTEYRAAFQNGINDMDLIQIIEMLADWKAASTRNSDTLKTTLDKTLERFGVNDQLALIIRTIADTLWW